MNSEVITMADSVLRDKAKEFAKTVVFLCRDKALQNDCGAIRRMLISSLKIIKSK